MHWISTSVLSLTSVVLGASQASAAVVLFDDAPTSPLTYWVEHDDVSVGLTSGTEPVYSGSAALRITSLSGYKQGGLTGLQTLGSTPPVDAPILQLHYYREVPGSLVVVNGSYVATSLTEDNKDYWTIDGVSGFANDTVNAWHTVRIDVAGLNLGSVIRRVGVKIGGAPGTWYMDDIAWVAVPEPSTLAMAGLAGAGLLARRRRRA